MSAKLSIGVEVYSHFTRVIINMSVQKQSHLHRLFSYFLTVSTVDIHCYFATAVTVNGTSFQLPVMADNVSMATTNNTLRGMTLEIIYSLDFTSPAESNSDKLSSLGQ